MKSIPMWLMAFWKSTWTNSRSLPLSKTQKENLLFNSLIVAWSYYVIESKIYVCVCEKEAEL